MTRILSLFLKGKKEQKEKIKFCHFKHGASILPLLPDGINSLSLAARPITYRKGNGLESWREVRTSVTSPHVNRYNVNCSIDKRFILTLCLKR